MKKALIITAIVVVVLVAAYLIRRATTKKFKFVKSCNLYFDEDLKEVAEGPIPVGKVLDLSELKNTKISFEGNLGVLTSTNANGREEIVYFDKSCVKPLIF
ncbi:MAG: hypothetical protein K5860_06640 [Bacteroidales bacterium]|nr:hypothetical protein [Bacteroidales bacterium]